MIFGGPLACKSWRKKLRRHEICAAEPATPSFLRWSDSAITYNCSYHLEYVPLLGRCPLMVDQIVSTKRLTKVLMDWVAAST